MNTIPLFGSGINSYSQVVTRQRRLNCLYDIRKDQDKSQVIVVGTPGSSVFMSLPTAPVRGWWVVGTTLYVVSGTTLYSVSAGGSYTTLGTLATVARDVGMKDNGVDLTIVDGIAGYTYRFSTGVIATITDVNFPNGCTSIDFLNGAYYVEKVGTREFHKSALLDGATWTVGVTSVYGTKENTSDNIVAVQVLNGNLIPWGLLSMEFWQDIGASPLPVQRVNGASQAWGLAAINSRAKIGNTLMFLGANPDGGVKVMQLNGYTPTPVSDSDLEYIINNMAVYEDARAMVYTSYGHPIYQLTFPSAARTFAYDTKTEAWHEAQTGLDTVGRHFANKGITFNGENYFADDTTGNVYLLDENVFTDNGTAIPREVCTRHIRKDDDMLFLSELVLDMETGVGNSASTDPVVQIQVSRDGGRTFGVERTKTLGAVGKYKTRARYRRLGSSRDFVVKIRMTDPVKFTLTSGSAEIEAGDG